MSFFLHSTCLAIGAFTFGIGIGIVKEGTAESVGLWMVGVGSGIVCATLFLGVHQ